MLETESIKLFLFFILFWYLIVKIKFYLSVAVDLHITQQYL